MSQVAGRRYQTRTTEVTRQPRAVTDLPMPYSASKHAQFSLCVAELAAASGRGPDSQGHIERPDHGIEVVRQNRI